MTSIYFQPLETAAGYSFKRPELLQQALTHRSFSASNNERFEFLGDSILNCVIALDLFERFKDIREGDLSRIRANLVCQDRLCEIALHLNLGEYLRLGEGERKSGGGQRPSILADALEALFGAIFLDGGFEQVRNTILLLYANYILILDPRHTKKDSKTALQEHLQGRHMALPQYHLKATHGEAHAHEFEVECLIPELGIATIGRGPSRRSAEQEAARQALAQTGSK